MNPAALPLTAMPDHELPERAPRISWRAVFALFTVAGLLRFTYFYLDDVTRGHAHTLGMRLLEEGTGAYTAMLWFPIIAYAERVAAQTSSRWRRAGTHAAAFVAYTVLHTTAMWGSRTVLAPLVGLGAYDYGRMPWRYLMEAGEDVLGYTLIVGLLTFLRVQQRLHDREVHALALARDAAESRLASLAQRVQPHFLFNALNTIGSLVYEDPATADEMVSRLGDLLRASLRAGESREISVAEELALLDAYVAFVRLRFGERLSVRVDADHSTHPFALPAFLLQPLVENAVRHGAASDDEAGEVAVSVRRAGAWLEVTVENDVASTVPREPGAGFGLQSTRDRLRLLYAEGHTFSARPEGARFVVRLQIPARRAPVAVTPARVTVSEPAYARADR